MNSNIKNQDLSNIMNSTATVLGEQTVYFVFDDKIIIY